MKRCCWLFVMALAASAARAAADADSNANADSAVDMQTFYASDKDGFQTFKLLAGYDVNYRDPEHYLGVALQHARYRGPGFSANYQRAYLNYADSRDNADGTSWKWNTLIGSDGHTWLGRAEIYREHADASRDDFFLERDIVETRDGTQRGIYYTLLGLSEDFTFTPRWSANGVFAMRDFTGDNLNTIVRGRLVYLLSEDWGLSAQLRARWLHHSHPHEYDYFSPSRYQEWIPALQLRRFHGGHQFRVALGYGRQRSSDSDWRPTKLAELEWTSPKRGAWFAKLNAGYTDTPINTGYAYAYRYVNLQVVMPLR